MAIIETNSKGQITIKSAGTFCAFLSSALPESTQSYRTILNAIDANVLAQHQNVTQGALNNCHGDWYEWLLACDGDCK
jgi:hypothetical protein